MNAVAARIAAARLLATPRLAPFLILALVDWMIITLSFAAAAHWPHPLLACACWVVIGTRQHALMILGHDGTHRLACRNRRTNDVVTALLCLWPIGVTLRGYRRFHGPHHRNPGAAGDPELPHKTGRLYDGTGRPGDFALRTLRAALGLDFVRYTRLMADVQRSSGLELWVLLGFQLLLATSLWAVGLGWIWLAWWSCVPTSCWAASSVREWGEHVGIAGTHRLHVPWLMRWLCYPHHSQMHYEHHACPGVPCWRLPNARALDRGAVTPLRSLLGEHLRG